VGKPGVDCHALIPDNPDLKNIHPPALAVGSPLAATSYARSAQAPPLQRSIGVRHLGWIRMSE
jgi:hypothetical protein